ncbi:hypothetical protein EJV47_07715 [Hymenobacter gummosus]|uniref:Uncharacterized protein n=1 Tax=Hymenobacter gummosus TaxID=1776032 RepID=A0A3S0HQ22_9BACT|nr:hypothetical protein [Hymenobacter gummosus]RTQ51674.1 hypothetical protein EJV47_07715 [Hymenobacter gummosus]
MTANPTIILLICASTRLLSAGTAASSAEPPRPPLTLRWKTLADTARYSVKYVSLNFDAAPRTTGGDVLSFLNNPQYPAIQLSNRQEWQLYRLATTPAFYSEGDCGTFHLNAGFVVYQGSRIVGTINVGCGFNQWNYAPHNPQAKWGGLNDQGFRAMQQLLDDIYAHSKP